MVVMSRAQKLEDLWFKGCIFTSVTKLMRRGLGKSLSAASSPRMMRKILMTFQSWWKDNNTKYYYFEDSLTETEDLTVCVV